MAEANKINPATRKAAPASKLTPELESFMENHRKRPTVIAAAEINISSACALTMKARGGFNGISVCWVDHVFCTFWLYNAYGTITTRLARYFLTPVSLQYPQTNSTFCFMLCAWQFA
jgi:hypothetical protein